VKFQSAAKQGIRRQKARAKNMLERMIFKKTKRDF
jgi:hypothetical protein